MIFYLCLNFILTVNEILLLEKLYSKIMSNYKIFSIKSFILILFFNFKGGKKCNLYF